MPIKTFIRRGLSVLKIDATKNLKYDRLTTEIISKVVKPDSICIDVGCHKGEILDLILKNAPSGMHYAFEPIPLMYNTLRDLYSEVCHVYPYALGEVADTTSFQYVKNAPAYSGIKRRKYDVKEPDIKEILVEVRLLDSIIPADVQIDFVKIDVEGGELGVLKGGINTLKRCKPVIIFECGIGASDYYGTTPQQVFELINQEIGLKIYSLDAWLHKKPCYTLEQFVNDYNSNAEYYFVASKE